MRDDWNDSPNPRRGPLRDTMAAAAGRIAARALRASGLGAGTTLPGRITDRLGPGLLERRSNALSGGVVLVSGTNGKTTTASMICAILEASGCEPVSNRSGANMAGGVVGAFLRPPAGATTAVLEVDEAALPALTRRLRPRALVLTNVFRDQLDRFGEPERVAAMLSEAVGSLPPQSSVIVNADDPLLWEAACAARLAGSAKAATSARAARSAKPIGFGVSQASDPIAWRPNGTAEAAGLGADADGEPATCPRCAANLAYSRRTIGHLGAASCPVCGWRSSRPRHMARVIAHGGLRGLVLAEGGSILTLPLGGVHNAYNAAAALATAAALGVPRGVAITALERFRPRFGRSEDLEMDGRRLWLGLIKNPAGAGTVMRTVASDRDVEAVVVAVNDQTADGRDVSWIWDAAFERLCASGVPLIPAGRRAEEVALRLKYAGAEPEAVEREPVRAIAAATERCSAGGTVAVLATYTAMLEARQGLLKRRAGRVEDRLPAGDAAGPDRRRSLPSAARGPRRAA